MSLGRAPRSVLCIKVSLAMPWRQYCATLTSSCYVSPSLPASLAFLPSHSRSSSTQSGTGLEADSRSSSRGSLEELPQSRHRESSSAFSSGMKQKMLLDYSVYMAKYVSPQVPSRSPTATDSPAHSPAGSPQTTKKV